MFGFKISECSNALKNFKYFLFIFYDIRKVPRYVCETTSPPLYVPIVDIRTNEKEWRNNLCKFLIYIFYCIL